MNSSLIKKRIAVPGFCFIEVLERNEMTPFEESIRELDLTYTQEELIKQAVETHIIGQDIDVDELMNESLGTMTIFNLYKKIQRQLLRGKKA